MGLTHVTHRRAVLTGVLTGQHPRPHRRLRFRALWGSCSSAQL